MPDYKAHFDLTFAKLIEADPSASDLLAEELRLKHKNRWATLVAEHRAVRPQMQNVYFDYVSNPILNLHAGYDINIGFGLIGIRSATVPVVYDTFYRMLAHPKVLPTVGNAAAESGRKPAGLFTDYRKVLANRDPSCQSLSDIAPKDPGRKRYAEMLAQASLDFLIFHELAHITLGHCEWLQNRGPMPFLTELTAVAPAGSLNLDKQALEIAADCAASVKSYTHILAATSDSEKSFRSILDRSDQLVVPDELMIFDWVFSTYVTFWILGQDIDLSRLDTATHPPAPRRATRAFNCVYSHLKMKVGDVARKQMLRGCEDAINAGAFALDQITGGDIRGKLDAYEKLEEDGTMARHFERLITKWGEIKDAVEKFKQGKM